MFQCKSGNHWWLGQADAEKCCNGFKRVLIVAEPGEQLPADAKPVRQISEARCGFTWQRIADESCLVKQ